MTQLEQITLQELRIPFRESFRHSSAARSETESVLVVASDGTGLQGFGESCPRSYVTGETLASVRTFFEFVSTALRRDVDSLNALKSWVRDHAVEIDANPAGWCAIELALLDLFARAESKSVEALLGIRELTGPFAYSAVIGEGSFESFQRSFERYLANGMTDIKLKVSGNLEQDRRKLRFLASRGGDNLRVRLDGNNLGTGVDDTLVYIRSLEYPLFAFEEPLAQNDHAGLIQLAEKSGVPVILDESFARIGQFDCLRGAEGHYLVNLRISKMGGVLRSLDIVAAARRRETRLIIGAQVGETSLLTRAALTVAEQSADLLEAQEGGFGSLLLTRDPWEPSLGFGRQGVLDPGLLGDAGFGLKLIPSAVR